MKKTLVVIIAVLLLCLAACAQQNPLTGTWELKTSYKTMAGSLPTEEELGNLSGYANFDGLYLTSVYTFAEDGTYTVKANTEQYIMDCRTVWLDAINAYYTDQIAQRNLDITVEEAWELDGISAETLVDETAVRTALADLNRTGNYVVRDGKLYLSAGTEYRVDESVYTEFTMSGDTLTFLASVGGEGLPEYPAVLTRAAQK